MNQAPLQTAALPAEGFRQRVSVEEAQFSCIPHNPLQVSTPTNTISTTSLTPVTAGTCNYGGPPGLQRRQSRRELVTTDPNCALSSFGRTTPPKGQFRQCAQVASSTTKTNKPTPTATAVHMFSAVSQHGAPESLGKLEQREMTKSVVQDSTYLYEFTPTTTIPTNITTQPHLRTTGIPVLTTAPPSTINHLSHPTQFASSSIILLSTT